MQIDFISGGFLGDFIHAMAAAKGVCGAHAVANIHITDGHGGDAWRFGVDKAYEDLKELVLAQNYVGSFQMLDTNAVPEPHVNLNDWRKTVATTHAETGKYDRCWTDLLSQQYSYVPKEYKWLEVDSTPKNIVVVHRSKRHHNSDLFWERMFNRHKRDKIVFVTCDRTEYDGFCQRDKCELLLVPTIMDMCVAIASAKLFLGNQSAPFAMACGLDVPRICELDPDPAPFYMGEERFSPNHQWWLNPQTQWCPGFKNR